MIKIEVTLHDAEKRIVEVEEYNAKTFEKIINDNSIFVVAIGDFVFNKNMIRIIEPVK